MILIERQAPSHRYLRDGRPFHEIAKKDDTGNRPVTLADARKVPALPRPAEESLDVFDHRVVVDMTEQVEKAAAFGSAKGTKFPGRGEGGPLMDPTTTPPSDHLRFDFDSTTKLANVLGTTRRGETTWKTLEQGVFTQ